MAVGSTARHCVIGESVIVYIANQGRNVPYYIPRYIGEKKMGKEMEKMTFIRIFIFRRSYLIWFFVCKVARFTEG